MVLNENVGTGQWWMVRADTVLRQGPGGSAGGKIQPVSTSLRRVLACTLGQGGETARDADLHQCTDRSWCLAGWPRNLEGTRRDDWKQRALEEGPELGRGAQGNLYPLSAQQ